MANGILGLGSAGSQGLNAEMIEGLKEADRKANVKPIEDQIEDWDTEVEQFGEVETKLNELLDIVKKLDLFSTSANAFETVFAKTSGTAAEFDSTDTSKIKPGTTVVDITQLAQKSVISSGEITNLDEKLGTGTLTISVGSGNPITIDTEGKTYKDIVDELNNYSKLDVSLEQVGDSTYKMVIKGSESGVANNLSITATGAVDTGFKQIQEATNMKATVDGIEYDLSSNNIMLQNGLNITALEKGTSSISIQRDTAAIQTTVQELVDKYNELSDLITEHTLSAESEITDKASLRTIMQDVKNIIFGSSYGNGTDSLFNYGIAFGENGYLSLDAAKFSDAVTNNFDDLKNLFIGSAENEGIGTQMKSYIDEVKGFDGLFTTMGDGISLRRDRLEEEKEKAIELIDRRYEQMAAQFAAYTGIITQFENSFGGLQMLIAQSVSSN